MHIRAYYNFGTRVTFRSWQLYLINRHTSWNTQESCSDSKPRSEGAGFNLQQQPGTTTCTCTLPAEESLARLVVIS